MSMIEIVSGYYFFVAFLAAGLRFLAAVLALPRVYTHQVVPDFATRAFLPVSRIFSAAVAAPVLVVLQPNQWICSFYIGCFKPWVVAWVWWLLGPW